MTRRIVFIALLSLASSGLADDARPPTDEPLVLESSRTLETGATIVRVDTDPVAVELLKLREEVLKLRKDLIELRDESRSRFASIERTQREQVSANAALLARLTRFEDRETQDVVAITAALDALQLGVRGLQESDKALNAKDAELASRIDKQAEMLKHATEQLGTLKKDLEKALADKNVSLAQTIIKAIAELATAVVGFFTKK